MYSLTAKIADSARSDHAIATGKLLDSKTTFLIDLEPLEEVSRKTIIEAFGVYGETSHILSRVLNTPHDWLEEARMIVANRTAEKIKHDAQVAEELASYIAALDALEALTDAQVRECKIGFGDLIFLHEMPRYTNYGTRRVLGSGNVPNKIQARANTINTRLEALQKAVRLEAQLKKEAQKLEADERVAAVKAKLEANRLAWITDHGSAYLKKAVLEGGYDCQRKYVFERAVMEHPGFVVDFNNEAEWQSRSCPSEVALDLALEVQGEVVWLQGEIGKDGTWHGDDEPREVVVIRGFLGKYDLIK